MRPSQFKNGDYAIFTRFGCMSVTFEHDYGQLAMIVQAGGKLLEIVPDEDLPDNLDYLGHDHLDVVFSDDPADLSSGMLPTSVADQMFEAYLRQGYGCFARFGGVEKEVQPVGC
jgi:hypothetical protein